VSQFKAEKQQGAEGLTVKVAGHIDEDAVFTGLELGGSSKVILDLTDVSAINSCGIREWIKWIRTAPESTPLVYRNCPKIIVDQINMVDGFLPKNAKVESFFVPYFCDSTGNEKMVLFKEGVEFKGNEVFAPASVKDDESGEDMEMDVIEAKYFKFLQR
jgi:anti-anti-sigma regulatory factor